METIVQNNAGKELSTHKNIGKSTRYAKDVKYPAADTQDGLKK